jgi:vancomycin resistance protein YoaR
MDRPSPPAARRLGGRRLGALIGGVAVVLAAVALGALASGERGRLPANVAIGGVDVGSRSRGEAHELVLARALRRLDRPIPIVGPGLRLTTSGVALGARPDIDAALDEADAEGALTRVGARLGLVDDRSISVRYAIDPTAFDELYARLARRLDREPRAAAVRVGRGGVELVPAREGRAVDRTALAAALAGLPGSIRVPTVERRPDLTTAAAARARALVERLLGAPRFVHSGDVRVRLRPAQLRRALRLTPVEGRLAVALDAAALARGLGRRVRRLERPAVDAAFVTRGRLVRIRPARPGRRLDLERVAASLVRNVGSLAHRARFVAVEPALPTDEARSLGVRERVSEFTTYYSCCQPRVTNIQRAAALLDGTIVRPGETFSLNEALGERTVERGFVAAPQIYDGRLEDAVGGGISQIATTLYNAAFFAGVKLVAHQAHQFYISRYPMGREATVSWGGPELIFRNDWQASLLIDVGAGDTSITVRFYSSRLGRRVETETGEPYGYRAPATITVANAALAPGTTSVVQSAGASGFTVQYTRKVFRGRELLEHERYTVRYDPQNAIVEVGPAKRKPKPGRGRGAGGADPAAGGARTDPVLEASAVRTPAG